MAADDLFSYARSAIQALGTRGVTIDECADPLTIDLRALGAVEILGTEAGAYLRFSGKLGEVRVILAPAAFFALRATFAKGPV